MKNLTLLVTPEEIQQYVYDLWKTDEFRTSHNTTDSIISNYIERFSRLPRIFADMSDPVLETPHFSAWWNVIMQRDTYQNPIIHDLYYLHEIIHAATITHLPQVSFDTFQRKMNENELETSLVTEILIYLAMPILRERSFPHEIYADRFLNKKFRYFWENDREEAIGYLRERRREIMFTSYPEKLDPIEGGIHLYASQNIQWQMVWKLRYNQVEATMDNFKQVRYESPHINSADRSSRVISLILSLLEWLEDPEHTQGTDIPFRREAEAFSAIYWNNKNHYREMIVSLHDSGYPLLRKQNICS